MQCLDCGGWKPHRRLSSPNQVGSILQAPLLRWQRYGLTSLRLAWCSLEKLQEGYSSMAICLQNISTGMLRVGVQLMLNPFTNQPIRVTNWELVLHAFFLNSIGRALLTRFDGQLRAFQKIVTWLILPVVIRSSQRLSHACLSINNCTVKLRMAHYISYSLFDSTCYLDNRSNYRANTCVNSQLLWRTGCIY